MRTKEHNKEEGVIAVIKGVYGSSGEEAVMN